VGGVEVHTSEVARRLVSAGVDVTVLTVDLARSYLPREERDGVKIRRLRAWPRKGDFYVAPDLYGEIVGGSWDILHLQGSQTLVAPIAMFAAQRARLPYVVTFHTGGHSSRIRSRLKPWQERALRPLLVRAERLVALTQEEAKARAAALDLPRDRFVVIPNGCDLPQPRSGTIVRDANLIASVGRLERYKGHHRVIAALPSILERFPEARLWIGGTGQYESKLWEFANELGVADRVEIRAIPVEERLRLATELSRVSVVVCLSEFETQGIAILEALAQGCRAVVAPAGGLTDVIQKGLARGIDLDSRPEDVAAAIINELQKPPLVEKPNFPTWDECAAELLRLYSSVVRRPLPT